MPSSELAMDVNKLIKVQYKRHSEIEKIFKDKGVRIYPLKDKIRIEYEDRLLRRRPELCLSACCVVTGIRYSGYFRYVEFYNKETLKLVKKSYVISNENNKQVRIYDDRHGMLHYHDVVHGVNKKEQKVNKVDFNGSFEDIVSDCIKLLQK